MSADSGKVDASVDAHAELDADAARDASGCSLDQSYGFGYSGGLVAWTDHFALSASGTLTKTRASTARFDAGNGSYRSSLTRCDELARAFVHPDVRAAYSDDDQVLGRDSRIVDGSVLVIEREDGKTITLGYGCNDDPRCTPIPAGVEALRSALAKLIQDNDYTPVDAGAGLCP